MARSNCRLDNRYVASREGSSLQPQAVSSHEHLVSSRQFMSLPGCVDHEVVVVLRTLKERVRFPRFNHKDIARR